MDSLLDRGLRALAWAALIATVAMLLASGAWLRQGIAAGGTEETIGIKQEPTTLSSAPMEDVR